MEDTGSIDVRAYDGGGDPAMRPIERPNVHVGVGDRLKSSSDALRRCGRTLSALVEPAGQTLIDEAVDKLGQQVFRVVVVGQIKSGKSSFINALVRQPHLLPTEVTPWTTAITNLHFAEPPPANYAAAFQFFSATEWQELAHGGGPLYELTQRLVPGLDTEALSRQVEALKQRAGRRLGAEFKDLLGGTHFFEQPSRDLLLHYVCSGDFTTDTPATGLGKYADITKQADLYMSNGPFSYPVTVTDTPGTNDPFLIRDEITRRSLKSADLFVVVLSARQPLSDSDLVLMRLMHGLNKNRIVAFVNRIDDFADVSYDLAEVLIYIEKKLQDEFPGSSIPVIAGSAAWANAAQSYDEALIDQILSRSSSNYLIELGLAETDDCVIEALSDPVRRNRLCKALMTASGLPAVYRAIGDRLRAGETARNQLTVAHSFREMTQATASSMRSELEALTHTHETSQRLIGERAELEKQAKTLDDVAENVRRSGDNIEEQLLRMLDEEMRGLRGDLQAAVDEHAAAARNALIEDLSQRQISQTWTHDGVELRRALADIFAERFRSAMDRIVTFQAKVAPDLNRLMGIVAPDMPRPSEPDPRVVDIAMPNVAALSRFVCLDLDGSWWSGFWKRRNSPEEYGEQIEGLIRSEFQSVVDELVETAEEALRAYVTTATRWSFGLCLNIVQAVKRQRDEMTERSQGANRVPAEQERRNHEETIKRLSERLVQCDGLHRQLGAICNELAAGLGAQSGSPQ